MTPSSSPSPTSVKGVTEVIKFANLYDLISAKVSKFSHMCLLFFRLGFVELDSVFCIRFRIIHLLLVYWGMYKGNGGGVCRRCRVIVIVVEIVVV